MLADPESLRCVELAATHLNFRAAAARVGLSAAAFTDRIQRLEASLGQTLFVRSTRTVRLSPAGEALLPQVRRCLAELRALEAAALAPAVRSFTLSVGTRWELGLSWLVPALDGLEAAEPERRIHLAFGDSPELLRRVLRGELDAAVTSFRATSPELAGALLHEETYLLVGAPELAARAPLRGPEDAPRHVLLDTAADLPLFRYAMDAVGGPAWPFARVELLGAIAAVRARALTGAGIAVLPRYFVAGDLEAGRLLPLLPELELPADAFRLWWRRGAPQTEALQRLAGELRALPLR